MRSARLAMAAVLGAVGGMAAMAIPASAFQEAPGISQASQRSIDKGTQNPMKPQSNKLRAIMGSGLGSWGGRQRRAGLGWTNRHARRVAMKKRNQAKHRAAVRGRRRT